MPTIVENKLITLNTRYAQRLNGTYLSDVVFPFRGILKEEDDIISSNICVMNAQFPASFYTINETNYTFRMKLTSAGSWITISLPFGNYNANTLITAIKAQITAIGTTVTIVLNSVNGKLDFSAPVSIDVGMITLTPLGATNFCYTILGFLASSTTSGTFIEAPYPLNLLGVNRLAIRSQKLTISSYNSITSNLGITLATIPVDVPQFSLINYTNQTDLNKAALQIKYIDLIDISIVDENNNPINFNNVDWTMTLVLENIRKIPDHFIPSFRELTSISQPEIKKEEVSQDVKEMELLA